MDSNLPRRIVAVALMWLTEEWQQGPLPLHAITCDVWRVRGRTSWNVSHPYSLTVGAGNVQSSCPPCWPLFQLLSSPWVILDQLDAWKVKEHPDLSEKPHCQSQVLPSLSHSNDKGPVGQERLHRPTWT